MSGYFGGGGGPATEVTVGTTVVDGGVTDVLLKTDSSGDLANATGVTNASGKVLTLTSQAATDEALTLKAAAVQSANIIEWLNSSDVIVFGGVTGGTHGAELRFGDTSTTDYGRVYHPGAGGIGLSNRGAGANAEIIYLGMSTTLAARVASGAQITWSSSTPDAAGGDVGIVREAANVAKITNASSGLGWLQNAGESRVTGNVTNATTTMANITGLSVTLQAGRTYVGRICVFCEDSVAADGIKFDFDGGTATATDFRAHATVFDTALQLSSQVTALATDFSVAVVTGSSMFEAYFTITCNAAGTFIPRFAQAAHTTGTATVFRGSYMLLQDCP